MPVNIMVDLETFGVGNEAALISIGAVKFDKDKIIERFHVGIDPESCEQRGLKISASTMKWWLDDDRRRAWTTWLALEKFDVWLALDGFSKWCAASAEDEVIMWGNGATFDNIILRSAYEKCGMVYPVKFWNDRCYRTVKGLAPEIKLTRVGVHHSAVDDAESQAVHLQQICAQLGVTL